MTLARRGITWMLRSRPIQRALCAIACARGRGLVLVYHRLRASAAGPHDVIPTVSVDVFRSHLQTLGEIADLVTLAELLAPVNAHRNLRSARPAVAVTFDDDLPSHINDALPVLRDMLVPAAFFLSGRALHGLGPYWFQQLEASLAAHGAASVATSLGMPASTPDMLALACEQHPELQRRLAGISRGVHEPALLRREDVAALSAAGMTIGFHTLDHDILTSLDAMALKAAVVDGRSQLAAAAGTHVRFFAYPHGKADPRSARAVRAGGFDAAFTGRPSPVCRRNDPYAIGRWEPGPLRIDDLIVRLAVHLHRPVRTVPA